MTAPKTTTATAPKTAAPAAAKAPAAKTTGSRRPAAAKAAPKTAAPKTAAAKSATPAAAKTEFEGFAVRFTDNKGQTSERTFKSDELLQAWLTAQGDDITVLAFSDPSPAADTTAKAASKTEAPKVPAAPKSEVAAKAHATRTESHASTETRVCAGACATDKPIHAFPTTKRDANGVMGRGKVCRVCRDKNKV